MKWLKIERADNGYILTIKWVNDIRSIIVRVFETKEDLLKHLDSIL